MVVLCVPGSVVVVVTFVAPVVVVVSCPLPAIARMGVSLLFPLRVAMRIPVVASGPSQN